MRTGKCPVCQSDVVIDDDTYDGDITNCANCESELEIYSLHPLQIREIEDDSEETND